MQLLGALMAGIAGASAGTAKLYLRGTTTPAPWWGDFEASDSKPAGTTVALDGFGRCEVYVADIVDVQVFTADGTLLCTFTGGSYDQTVEVISPSFGGADYETGVPDYNKPTTLGAVLDRWLTSAGAPDFQVMVGGVARDLDDACDPPDRWIYNARSVRFGAKGDDATDDATAIQAAITAASANGGGTVVLPPGSYRIGTALQLPGTVNLVGAGPGVTLLKMTHATRNIVELSANSTGTYQLIEGIAFQATAPNTGRVLFAKTNVVAKLLVRNCNLSHLNLQVPGTTGSLVGETTSVASHWRFDECSFVQAVDSQTFVSVVNAAAVLELTGCYAADRPGCTSVWAFRCGGLTVARGCVFDGSQHNAGNILGWIHASANDCQATVVGNVFLTNATIKNFVFYSLYGSTFTGRSLHTSGNTLPNGMALGFGSAVNISSANSDMSCNERDHKIAFSSVAVGGGVSIVTGTFGLWFVTVTGVTGNVNLDTTMAGAPGGPLETTGPVGSKLTVYVYNTASGNATIIFGTSNFRSQGGAGGTAVATGVRRVFQFVLMDEGGGTVRWTQVASSVVVT